MESRREALEAAFDKVEGSEDETVVSKGPGNEGHEDKHVQAPEERVDAEGGEKADNKLDLSKAPDKEPKKDDEYSRAGKAADGKVVPPAAQAAVQDKPPVSWKPTAKEVWSKLPAEARSEIARREKEMSQFISQNDHHRRFNEQFAQTVKPFENLIRAQNSTPLQAVRNLMTTAAGLATGNKQQKAQIVADIIANYGIDIETLDLTLSGKGAQIRQNSGPGDVNPQILQMIQPIYGFMDEVRQAREMHEQRRQQEADSLVENFADRPYFDDLREEMADILDIAARRGLEMTIEQAYEKAIALNPEVSEIIAKQKAAEKARETGTRLAKARRLASTITGAPAGVPDGRASAKSRKEQLEAAWDDSTQH